MDPVHDQPITQPTKFDTQQRYRAMRATASLSDNAADCAHLLDMLGLHPAEGKVPA